MVKWVLDASHSNDEAWCYIPVEGLDTANPVFVTGMNLLAGAGVKPEVNVVGVVHEQGREAVERWITKHWPQWPEWRTA